MLSTSPCDEHLFFRAGVLKLLGQHLGVHIEVAWDVLFPSQSYGSYLLAAFDVCSTHGAFPDVCSFEPVVAEEVVAVEDALVVCLRVTDHAQDADSGVDVVIPD